VAWACPPAPINVQAAKATAEAAATAPGLALNRTARPHHRCKPQY
jgi:hypothetical protein